MKNNSLTYNTVYHESNLETMSRIPDDSLDLTVTSPPYDNMCQYESGQDWDYQMVLKELYRVTKPGGVVVWITGDQMVDDSETLTSFKHMIYGKDVVGWNIWDTMSYVKHGPSKPSKHRYHQVHEYMFILSKGRPKTFNCQLRQCVDGHVGMDFNVWNVRNGFFSTKDKVSFEHPCTCPEELVLRHVLSWSNPGYVVYDPFTGSGTLPKVCITTRRRYVGSEISEKYMGIIKRRLQPYQNEEISLTE